MELIFMILPKLSRTFGKDGTKNLSKNMEKKRKLMEQMIAKISNNSETKEFSHGKHEWNPTPSESFYKKFEYFSREEVDKRYIELSEMLREMLLNHKIVKLLKNQYGLKQGAANWYNDVDKRMQEFGLKRCVCDHCLYWIKTRTIIYS